MKIVTLLSLVTLSLIANDTMEIVYKNVLNGLDAICKKGVDGEVTFYKGNKLIKNYKIKLEVDGGFKCELYFSKKTNSFYYLGEDSLNRVNLDTNKKEEVVFYDSIGTLYGYKFNKDESKLLSWGGDVKQVVKITNLKTLKSKVVAKIDVTKVKKVIFSKDEKSAIIVNKDSTKKVVALDR